MTTNHATIAGNLATDPQIRYSREGVAETTLTVSVDQAEGEPGPDLVTVICHGELAENVCLSLVRHARIVASGRLLVTSQSFEDVHPVCQYELWATEIGASLRFATADVSRVRRARDQA